MVRDAVRGMPHAASSSRGPPSLSNAIKDSNVDWTSVVNLSAGISLAPSPNILTVQNNGRMHQQVSTISIPIHILLDAADLIALFLVSSQVYELADPI